MAEDRLQPERVSLIYATLALNCEIGDYNCSYFTMLESYKDCLIYFNLTSEQNNLQWSLVLMYWTLKASTLPEDPGKQGRDSKEHSKGRAHDWGRAV